MSRSERRTFEIDETKRRIYQRAGWRCEYVDEDGDRCFRPGVEIGHIIPQDEMHIKIFGEVIVHHPANLRLTCGKYHNSKVELDVKTQPVAVAEHVARLQELIKGESDD